MTERYSKPFKRSWKYDEREVTKFLSHRFKAKAAQISKQEVQRLHEQICNENGLYQANRLLERMRAIYNKAIEWGWTGTNPTNGIKKFKEKSRDRFIQPNELPRFFDSLNQELNETVKDYVYLSIFTGARKSNVLTMKWEEIDFDRNTWRIPETKNGESHIVPLIDQAIDIIKKRQKMMKKLKSQAKHQSESQLLSQEQGKTLTQSQLPSSSLSSSASPSPSPFIFPGTGKDGHLSEPKRGWKRILDRANIKDLRIHDIRRTMGSYQAITGASLSIIGKTLGHKSQTATQIYARMHDDPVRASMEKAAEEMFKNTNTKNAVNLVSLDKKLQVLQQKN